MIPVIRTKTEQEKRLKYLMQMKGLTTREISKYLSLSVSDGITRWLEGIKRATIDNLYAGPGLFPVKIDEQLVVAARPSRMPQLPESGKRRMYLYYMRLCGNSSGAAS